MIETTENQEHVRELADGEHVEVTIRLHRNERYSIVLVCERCDTRKYGRFHPESDWEEIGGRLVCMECAGKGFFGSCPIQHVDEIAALKRRATEAWARGDTDEEARLRERIEKLWPSPVSKVDAGEIPF